MTSDEERSCDETPLSVTYTHTLFPSPLFSLQFERAAELRVEGKVGASITVLRRLLQLHPRQPRALFALGQLHALLRDWRASEMHYMDAANNEQVCGAGGSGGFASGKGSASVAFSANWNKRFLSRASSA